MDNRSEQSPLPVGQAALAVARCVAATVGLLARRRIHIPRGNVGLRLGFADGTTAAVFRETEIAGASRRDPCILVVEFTLRGVRGRGHALFRRESLLNTILFAGFPGLITKLWLAHDQRGAYRGLYEWDAPALAESYARALWGILALVSVPGSIRYHVIPGLGRDELFAAAGTFAEDSSRPWWRPTAVTPA
ncbi:hypothetical protein GPX89_14020 [Nocardia sp. ET3-3]|uniref:Uncharacterized protein n=1 Tax=Nocardia terrae TaxID=2675851 RepID=A0A7K1UWX0_9NOCA|nr:hypothetical protein [Nocardia terrae]MVU78358.1 hypothetical protein [Nocardia terrae]